MSTKLIVGLGNPEQRFDLTRHNIGFAIVDSFADVCNLKDGLLRTNDDLAPLKVKYGIIDNEHTVIVLKPQDWINNSGFAVWRARKALRLKPKDIMVVHDDMDFDFGKVRIKPGGSSGRHNGVGDIIKYCTNKIVRFRIGVGRPLGKKSSRDHVLSEFNSQEQRVFPSLYNLTSDAIHSYVVHGVQQTMNKINRKVD
ncbi:hypothetical protein LCGC14_0762240 [marine sediment metagenome]|uniref:peptidyl-tRNA hydrolase n=1 Tax=marine sediment metagenome TaxID=412755 RepID=A0A0F9SKS2_9ZZZZ